MNSVVDLPDEVGWRLAYTAWAGECHRRLRGPSTLRSSVLLLGQEGHYLLRCNDEDILRDAKAKAKYLYHRGLYPRIFQDGIGDRVVVVVTDRHYPTVTETPVIVANAAHFAHRSG